MRPSFDAIEAAARRRRVLRTILFLIILGTLPFYCLGFILWGTAPASRSGDQTVTATLTWTPIGRDVTSTKTLIPSITPLFTGTAFSPLQPTPIQFNPGSIPTRFLSDTPPPPQVIIPTSTTAPTLTLPPTEAPFPTDTPLPSITPPPTETPLPPATDTFLPPPTDTPVSEPVVETTQSVGP